MWAVWNRRAKTQLLWRDVPYKSWPQGNFMVYPEQVSKTFIISYPQSISMCLFLFFFPLFPLLLQVFICVHKRDLTFSIWANRSGKCFRVELISVLLNAARKASGFVCGVRLSSGVVRGWITGGLKSLVMLEMVMMGSQLVSGEKQSAWLSRLLSIMHAYVCLSVCERGWGKQREREKCVVVWVKKDISRDRYEYAQ